MNQVTIDEILSYIDEELTETRKLEIEKVLLDDVECGKMFLTIHNLRQQLGSTKAIKEHLRKEKQLMIKRIIKDK